MKAKLDHAYCLTAMCLPGRRKTDFWDTHIPGLVLEVRSSGGKTYALRYIDAGGRQRQLKIGAFDVISNAEARKMAKRLRAEVELGGNPQVAKEEKKAVPLYSELARQHLEHAKAYLRSHGCTEMTLRRHILPRWKSEPIDAIKTQDVSKWLNEKSGEGLAPATVERIRATFARSYELGAKWGVPGAQTNPVRHVPRRKINNARERFLTADEAARLHEATAKSENTQLRYIVGLLLLCGSRKMELLRAKWEHIDLDRRSWFIPDSKSGKPRHVPLSDQALELIRQVPRWEGCGWLVPNPSTRRPYNSIKRAWDTARTAAGLPGLRLHDLRHSFCSAAVAAGIDLYTVGKIVGHADYQSTQRYAHVGDTALRRAVEAGAATLNVNWSSAGGANHGV